MEKSQRVGTFETMPDGVCVLNMNDAHAVLSQQNRSLGCLT